MTSPLATAVASTLPPDSGIRVGVVTALESTSTITVNVGGGVLTGMPFLNSYIPAVGDNVQIVRMDATWLCVGVIGAYPSNVIAGVRATSTTTVGPTSAGTELDLPFLSFTAAPRDDHTYEIFTRLLVTQSVATDVFEVRMRRDTALTGTQIGLSRSDTGATSTIMDMLGFAIYESAAAEDAMNIFISVARVGGTGTLTVFPRTTGGNSQFSSYAKMTDMGLSFSITGSAWRRST